MTLMKKKKKNQPHNEATTKLHHKFDIFAILLMGANNGLMRTLYIRNVSTLHGHINIIFFNLSFEIVYMYTRDGDWPKYTKRKVYVVQCTLYMRSETLESKNIL